MSQAEKPAYFSKEPRIFLLKNRSTSPRQSPDALSRNIQSFRRTVWFHYRKNGRHTLPWRKTKDPYKILVSEVMLQQTQVERVIPFYKNFLKKFPTPKALASAPLADVLRAWQGLGYNRRARMLQSSAKEVVELKAFPKTAEALEELSGVGPYTARAVSAFAYNQDGIVIETNIRTAVIHHFFPLNATQVASGERPKTALAKKKKVSDTEIEKILAEVLPKGKAREWYSALMDYGAHLKRSGISHNARTKSYTKQSVFKGSLREARGAVLRALAVKPAPQKMLENLLGAQRVSQTQKALQSLTVEKLVEKKGKIYSLPH
jgi:A/G-specific adenine glycosylase